jgi:hypothetical protein
VTDSVADASFKPQAQELAMKRVALLLSTVLLAVIGQRAMAGDPAPLTMIVMDPLAAPLACPCVKGYAQRDYEKLARQRRPGSGGQ